MIIRVALTDSQIDRLLELLDAPRTGAPICWTKNQRDSAERAHQALTDARAKTRLIRKVRNAKK